MNRKKSREYLLQLVYQMGITGDSAQDVFDMFMEDEEISKNNLDLEYIKTSLIGIAENKEIIEEKISAQLVNWKINRIAKVNLAILKVAVYEMMHKEDIPAKVSINEAIELCKKFSEEKSISFINGVLDKIYKNL
ncbi:transcription antitermination factor NusB [Clostridium massiliamazoniense]|uniref:transcription antitermination factor NusB n=1 Tax=Clostridium massiliamazoniense TaxID=1347366 RepID=UPI0006D7D588|nr:transcription antitermination factor NusB [Clostridium massiliamazoniense]